MAIKVIAQRREVKLGKNPGMKFVMRPDLYIPIAEKKVFSEASTHSGISAGDIEDNETTNDTNDTNGGGSNSGENGSTDGTGHDLVYGVWTDCALKSEEK